MPAPRQSAEIKSITGSREPQKAVPEPFETLKVVPKPPDSLPNSLATREWKRLAPVLIEKDRLTAANLGLFTILISTYGSVMADGAKNASLLGTYLKLQDLFGLNETKGGQGGIAPQSQPANPFARNGRHP